jgi:thiosulfate dehydrogenase
MQRTTQPILSRVLSVSLAVVAAAGLCGLLIKNTVLHAATAPKGNAGGWACPDPASVPHTPEGDAIRLGKQIFDETPKYAAAYTGDQLSCNDCHTGSGTTDHAASMVGLSGLFPMYTKRAGRVISLQQRIQECFTRSENGTPPPIDSKQMKALTAYIDLLTPVEKKGEVYPGRGLVQLPALTGDPKHGGAIYAQQCASCHGDDGAGMPSAFPPLWGPGAYNDGAGMHKIAKMAAFLVPNMPQDNPGTLSPQDAYDVAAYIHAKPHPKFNPAYKGY